MTHQTQIDQSLDNPLMATESDVDSSTFSPTIIPRTPPSVHEKSKSTKRNLLSHFSLLAHKEAQKEHDKLAAEAPRWMISEGMVRSR